MRFFSTLTFLFIGISACFARLSIALADENGSTIAVVVGSSQNIEQLKLSANELSLIYWRKQLYWPHGRRIKPVNLSSNQPLRLHFSHTILGSLPKDQVDYWNGLYFNGVLPPHVVNSEEAMLRYVNQTSDSIGYINACKVDERVKPVFWITGDTVTATKPNPLNCPN